MPPAARRPFLLICLLVATFLPLAGGWLRWGGLPPGYGNFPPQWVMAPPGFSPLIFAIACFAVTVMSLFLLVPAWFGFKAPAVVPPVNRGPLPYWFWPGVGVMLLSWALMWFGGGLFARFSFVPLWWGLICAVDGGVYALTLGRSLIAGRKHEMLVLAVVSVIGWFLFEYWNYFVLANWYYPYSSLLTPFGNLAWFSLSYTTVWPICFEVYMLLTAIPAMRLRWAHGPQIKLSTALVVGALLGGFALQFSIGLFPRLMFWGLWIGSLLIFGSAVQLAGFWTPFEPATRGDWSRFMLMALGTFLTGFVWEFWNHGSQAFRHGVASNPNYWIYDIPFVNVGHFFSEMPAVGYFGYLFFGILVWAYWLVIAHLAELDPDFAHKDAAGSLPEAAAWADARHAS